MKELLASTFTTLFFSVGMILTRVWGHFLIPVVVGSILWLVFGSLVGWTVLAWCLWTSGFIVVGWLITFISWVRYDLDNYKVSKVVDDGIHKRDLVDITRSGDNKPIQEIKPLSKI